MQRPWGTAAFGGWPDERQRLLVAAAVYGDERARSAWDRWRAGTTREQVTGADGRLMATAFGPLRRLGADDPLLDIAFGLHRRAWYTNQLALRAAAGIVSRLAHESLEVVVLKGAALCLQYYPDLGSRPMGDVDLLLAPGTLDRAVPALADIGWQVVPGQGSGRGPLAYAIHVQDKRGHEVDLHEYALMQSADDADLWDGRVEFDLVGVPTATLTAADHLLHVCAHGLRGHPDASARWAVDAAMIMCSDGPALDWARFVDRAQARRLTVAAGAALSWLQQTLGMEVPVWVLRELRTGPRLRFERTVHAIAARPPNQLSLAAMSVDRYRRFSRLAPVDRRPASFAAFLRGAWEVESSRQAVLLGGRKLARRFL